MKQIVSRIFSKIAILTAILSVALAASYLYAAWNGPAASPPDGNVATPLNVTVVNQVKNAGLSLLSLVVDGKVQIQDGTEGLNKVLVSDSAGVSSWKATSSLDFAGGGTGDSDVMVTIATTNDPNNESCSASCPAGTVLIGGGCDAVPESPLQVNGPNSAGDTWQCETSPNISFGGYSGGLTCSALCGGGSSMPTCADGEMLLYNSSTGSWDCSPVGSGSGAVTELNEGDGINLSPNPITDTGSVSADTSYVQRRVSGTCPAGEAIRSIDSNGSVVCEVVDPAGAPTCSEGGNVYSVGASCEVGYSSYTCSDGWTRKINKTCSDCTGPGCTVGWQQWLSSCFSQTAYPDC